MESLKRYERRRRYRRLQGTKPNPKRLEIVVFGGSTRRFWRIRSAPKLVLKSVSPLKLWGKIKSAYMKMMINFSGEYLKDGDALNGKRISKAAGGGGPVGYRKEQFESRLIFEIYKSLMASNEIRTPFA